MFKRIANAFGKKKKRSRKGERKLRPGEGIAQLAAALPTPDDVPAPAPVPAAQPAPPPDPQPRNPAAREALINEAMRIRNEKAEVLKDLPARDQARLRKLAEKMLLGGIDEDEGGERKNKRSRH